MKLSKRMQVLPAAAAAAVFLLSAGSIAQAAPASYETAVQANNPYVYYRLQETGTLTDQPANDSSLNNRDGGVYRGDPTGGVAGAGTASDTAVSFPGATDTGLDYLRTDSRSLGSQVGRSSYEFVFKANSPTPSDPLAQQVVFGVFNAAVAGPPARTQNGAVEFALFSNATGNANATLSRFYVRDEDGIALGGTIPNATAGQYDLLDGNFHHVVFTYDLLGGGNNHMDAYVDGVPVPIAHVYQGGGNVDNAPDNFLDFTVDPTLGARNLRGTVQLEANVTLDEAAFYSTVLSPEQVAANFAATGIPEPTSLALLSLGAFGLMRRRR